MKKPRPDRADRIAGKLVRRDENQVTVAGWTLREKHQLVMGVTSREAQIWFTKALAAALRKAGVE